MSFLLKIHDNEDNEASKETMSHNVRIQPYDDIITAMRHKKRKKVVFIITVTTSFGKTLR